MRESCRKRGERDREGGNLNLNINNPEETPPSKKVCKHLNRYCFLCKGQLKWPKNKRRHPGEMGGGEDETETQGLK